MINTFTTDFSLVSVPMKPERVNYFLHEEKPLSANDVFVCTLASFEMLMLHLLRRLTEKRLSLREAEMYSAGRCPLVRSRDGPQ